MSSKTPMNLQIEWRKDSSNRRGFVARLRPLFTNRLGWIALGLNATLLISECHYLNALHADNAATHLLGPASALGLILTYTAVRWAHGDVKRRGRARPIPVTNTGSFYLTLTDDYLERGIAGLSFQRFQWRMFTGFKENASRFMLNMTTTDIPLEKADLKGAGHVAEIREFLQFKRRP
jgi:hypothetical protein